MNVDEIRSSPRSRLSPLAKTCLWVGLAILLPLLVAVLIFIIWAPIQLEDELESLHADGYATSLEELVPRCLQQDEDSAPLYEDAFSQLDDSCPITRLELAWEDLGYAGVDPDRRKQAQLWLELHEPAFVALTKVMDRPGCSHALDFSGRRTLTLERFEPFTRACDFLCLRAQCAAERGDHASARESLRIAFRLVDDLRTAPFLEGQLIYAGCAYEVLHSIECCVTATTPREELQSWLEMLPPDGHFAGALERGLRGELAEIAEAVTKQPQRLQEMIWQHADHSDMRFLGLLGWGPYRAWEGARCLRRVRWMVDASRPSSSSALADIQSLKEIRYSRDLPTLHPVAFHLACELARDGWGRWYDLPSVELAVLRGGLRCELEWHKTGTYPLSVNVTDQDPGTAVVLEARWFLVDGCHWPLRHPR